jgi:hypothetical protein
VVEAEERKSRCDQKVVLRLGQRVNIMVVQDYDKN